MSDIETAEARFLTVTNDGKTTHIARVTFPDANIAVGIGDTPEEAMKDAFTRYAGFREFSYGPGYHWNKPAWLTETGDETESGDLEEHLGDHDVTRSN
jgi:hypothetical protein